MRPTISVRWTVPDTYTMGREYETFDAAVDDARAGIQTFDYRPTVNAVTYSRAFVALRQVTRDETGSVDEEVLRWEVFRDRVVLVPKGQGGLTQEQADRTERVAS